MPDYSSQPPPGNYFDPETGHTYKVADDGSVAKLAADGTWRPGLPSSQAKAWEWINYGVANGALKEAAYSRSSSEKFYDDVHDMATSEKAAEKPGMRETVEDKGYFGEEGGLVPGGLPIDDATRTETYGKDKKGDTSSTSPAETAAKKAFKKHGKSKPDDNEIGQADFTGPVADNDRVRG